MKICNTYAYAYVCNTYAYNTYAYVLHMQEYM